MKISLAENFRAVIYAPFYALRSLGFAEDEGVFVDWLPPRSPGMVFNEVKRNEVDLAWGGPMRVMKDHESSPPNGASLVCFGEVVSRDPFYLLAKTDSPAVGLSALPGLRLAVVSEVPTPWLCLQADLQEAGIDVAALLGANGVVSDLTMAQQLRALHRGELDVAQLFEPFVSEGLADGIDRVLYAACNRGPTLYTTFICSRDGMARCNDAYTALTRALQKVQDWIATQGADELARVVAPYFAEIPATLLRSAIRRYYADKIWARHPEISRAGFERLARSLHATGFIMSAKDYDHCVHNFATDHNAKQLI